MDLLTTRDCGMSYVYCDELGRTQDEQTLDARLGEMVSYLSSANPEVRDAAACGLAIMDNPRALPAMKSAAATEISPLIRDTLRACIEELEAAQARGVN